MFDRWVFILVIEYNSQRLQLQVAVLMKFVVILQQLLFCLPLLRYQKFRNGDYQNTRADQLAFDVRYFPSLTINNCVDDQTF